MTETTTAGTIVPLTSDGFTLQCSRCAGVRGALPSSAAIDLEAGSAALGRFVLEHSSPTSLAHVPAPACCDGTGWTGNPRERCADHYEAPGFTSAGLAR